MGHSGSQEAHTGQALGADQLPAAFVHLMGQIAVHVMEPLGHVVEGGGQVLHLVVAVDLDAMLEVALGDPAGPALQIPDRVEEPAIKET